MRGVEQRIGASLRAVVPRSAKRSIGRKRRGFRESSGDATCESSSDAFCASSCDAIYASSCNAIYVSSCNAIYVSSCNAIYVSSCNVNGLKFYMISHIEPKFADPKNVQFA